MKITAIAFTLVCAGFSTNAFTQTCASPTFLQSNFPLIHTTCGGTVGLNLGGTILPHPSIVFRFAWEATPDGNEPDQIILTGADREMALVTSCTAAPIAAGAPGAPINLDSAGLTNGSTYLLVVTTDPGLPVTNPPRCGTFTISPDTLPVEVQSFTVE